MSIDVMLSKEEISFRNEFKAFLDRLDLSFILRMDKEDEQEVLALISEMVIEIFAMESALLRALKTMEKGGDEKFQLQRTMTKVYVNDALERVERCAKQILSAIAERDTLRTQLSALKKLTRFTPVNTVILRREIADAVIKVGKYSF